MEQDAPIFGIVVFLGLCFVAYKVFEWIDDRKLSNDAREGWQLFSLWAIIFVLPGIVIFLLTAVLK